MAVTWQTSAPSGVTFGSAATSNEVNYSSYNSSSGAYTRFQISVGHQYSSENIIWVKFVIQGKKKDSSYQTQTVSVTTAVGLSTSSYTATSAISLSITATGYTTYATRYAKITGGTPSSTVYARMAQKPLSTTVYNTATIASPIPSYTISYNKGAYGAGTNTTATKTYGIALTLKGAIFTRSGYTQTGWSTTDGGAKTYNLGASYTANAAATLYPFWEANGFNIHNAASGTVSQVKKIYRVQNGAVEQVSAAYRVSGGVVTSL